MRIGNFESLLFIWPELIITGAILVLLLCSISRFRFLSSEGFISGLSVLVLVVALVAIYFTYQNSAHYMPASIFTGMMAYDLYSIFFKIIFVLATLVVVLFSLPILKEVKIRAAEYYALLLSCLLGMCCMASASNLLMMYLSLEFVGVASYALTGLLRRNRLSAEAALKYIIYGAVASGIMIYGMSYLYGITGTLDIKEIGERIQMRQINTALGLVMSVFILAGLCYKVAAVPFHFWCPDVYQGAPTPITAFFSVGPKAAAFAMLIRFLVNVFGAKPLPIEWQYVIAIIAVFSMALGNLVALLQNNLKRLFAYSSIAHAGYIMLALVISADENIASVLFYLFVYMIMNLGAFLAIILLETRYNITTISDCSGAGWRAALVGGVFCIFLFSLVGLPPFAGFVAKILVFGYVIKAGFIGISLVVIAVIFSVISLGYYAKIVERMFLYAPAEHIAVVKAPLFLAGLLWVLGIATILFGVWWGWLFEFAIHSVKGML